VIADLTVSTMFALTPAREQGAGEVASYVSRMVEENRDNLLRAEWTGTTAAFNALARIVAEKSMPNWDGYDADPVDHLSYRKAIEFIKAMPLGLSLPGIGAEPDGQITLEWYRSPHQLLSVSVDPKGELHYAALLGPETVYGTVPFFGDIPGNVLTLINRATS